MDRCEKAIKEHNRFGPWVFEISDDDPVPPIFQSFIDEAIPSVLRLKVPRTIERRQASPGMDLYDYLITFKEESFEILHRRGKEVTKKTALYKDLLAIRCSQDLLNGTVSLFTGDNTYSFPFNTVSEELIDRVMAFLVERFPKLPSPREVEDEAGGDEKTLGPHFSRLLNKERQDAPQYRCFGAQGQVSALSRNDSLFKRLWYGIIDKRTFESLHFCDGHVLKILGRGSLYRYRGRVDYTVDEIYIPLSSFGGVDWSPDPQQPDVVIFKYRAGGEIFAFAVTGNSIEIYKKYLQNLKR